MFNYFVMIGAAVWLIGFAILIWFCINAPDMTGTYMDDQQYYKYK